MFLRGLLVAVGMSILCSCVVGTSSVPPCAASQVRRRRRQTDMCACRRRSGTQDLERGWACVGNQLTAPPTPPPALRGPTRNEASEPTPTPTPCSAAQVRRRRRQAAMCSCRRRSDTSDLGAGWSCEGSKLRMPEALAEDTPTIDAPSTSTDLLTTDAPSTSTPAAPTPSCSEAMVSRRRRQSGMCSCRRRSDGSDLGAGWSCKGSRLEMAPTPPPTLAPTAVPTPPTREPTPQPTPDPTPAPPVSAEPIRFLSYNVYVFTLRHRLRRVASTINEIAPQIASIQELWHEKDDLLRELIDVSNQSWDFARGGRTETVNDADILFRTDIWELLDSGLLTYGAGRGTNWAVLRRKSDLAGVLVYGTHPQCCRGDGPVLPGMELSTWDMQKRQEEYPYPVVFMGDFNNGYFSNTNRLLRDGVVNTWGKEWSVPFTFTDAVALYNPDDPDASTINNAHVRLDYVYIQQPSSNISVNFVNITDGRVWQIKGGSDHRPVSADVVLG